MVVFSDFPYRQEYYTSDIRFLMEQVIEKFGLEEWRLNVLTGEMHGHLGVYTVIGVKMGLYAKSILNSGNGQLVIVSNTGYKPPLSCLNDGLQVSTGSTLGHGLISIRKVKAYGPIADFTFKGETVRISLKDEFKSDLTFKINQALKQSGGLTDEYWQKIRDLAIHCWREFDRHKIFDSRQISNATIGQ